MRGKLISMRIEYIDPNGILVRKTIDGQTREITLDSGRTIPAEQRYIQLGTFCRGGEHVYLNGVVVEYIPSNETLVHYTLWSGDPDLKKIQEKLEGEVLNET